MKFFGLVFLILLSFEVFSQQTVKQLQYANTLITAPENCNINSEYEIIDCNGFSAQWLFLNNEMIQNKVHEQILAQIAQQIEYKSKKSIKFLSQNQPFEGIAYRIKNGTYRIVGFGTVDEIPLVLNLGFDREPKNNGDLKEFEKNFIHFHK